MSRPNFNVCFLSYNESSKFTNQLKRNSNAQSIYKELFDGDQRFKFLFSKSSYHISNPRLNICLLCEANEFIKYMIEDVGVIPRFLCNAPRLVISPGEKVTNYSLAVFMYIIQRYHQRQSIFVYLHL